MVSFLRLWALLLFSFLSASAAQPADAPEPLPAGLTPQQELEIALAREAMAEAVAHPEEPLESHRLDAQGVLVDAATGLPRAQAQRLQEAYATDLLMAAMSGDQALVEASLSQGARLEAVDAQGRSPLALAAMNGRVELVRELLRLGARREARDANGLTALELTRLMAAESAEEGDHGKAAQLALVADALTAQPPRAS